MQQQVRDENRMLKDENKRLKDEVMELKTKQFEIKTYSHEMKEAQVEQKYPPVSSYNPQPYQQMNAAQNQIEVRNSIDNPKQSMSPVPDRASRYMSLDELKA